MKLAERKARLLQKKMEGGDLEVDSDDLDSDDDDNSNEPMKHLKKKMPVFRDQDESIAYFIENLKKLIFLNR